MVLELNLSKNTNETILPRKEGMSVITAGRRRSLLHHQ
jgi:hypothetical protein